MLDEAVIYIRELAEYKDASHNYAILDGDNGARLGMAMDILPGPMALLPRLFSLNLLNLMRPLGASIYQEVGPKGERRLLFSIRRREPMLGIRIDISDTQGKAMGWLGKGAFAKGRTFAAFDAEGRQYARIDCDWKAYTFRIADMEQKETAIIISQADGVGLKRFTNPIDFKVVLAGKANATNTILALATALGIGTLFRIR